MLEAREVQARGRTIGLDIQVQPLPLDVENVKMYLTRGEIHKYFPKQAFSELKSPFNQLT